ncbi:hypothetical protein [Deinococcus ruber]|uniref:Uncharacterized protein n=1 Tax=Deinococcus ruber TaxID=1848197 RepID=A0A918CDQ7_9DEIO|nr:hypothetical protein [Deinococcus ruber]GGR17795.1 hypothetical protein GCM10008957_33170 [Deinococcus ruber]
MAISEHIKTILVNAFGLTQALMATDYPIVYVERPGFQVQITAVTDPHGLHVMVDYTHLESQQRGGYALLLPQGTGAWHSTQPHWGVPSPLDLKFEHEFGLRPSSPLRLPRGRGDIA